MAGFLVLQIQRNTDNGTFALTHAGLIDKILDVMGMEESNIKYAPADKVPLHNDLDGAPFCDDWYYCSIVGMFLYLAGST